MAVRTSRHRASRAAGVLAAAALLGSCTGTGSGARTATAPPRSSTAASVKAVRTTPPTPAGGRLAASIPMPSPGSVVTAFGSVWVTNGPAQTITRLDPRTDAVIARISTPDPASVIGAGAGAVWLTSNPGNSLTRIDPGTNRTTRTISLAPRGAGAIGVTVFRGFVWVANHDGEPTTSISKINPTTMRVVDVVPVGGGTDSGPSWIVSGARSIWTNVSGSRTAVVRVDPVTDRILATIPDPSACAQLAADDTAVWSGCGDDPSVPGLARIDPRTNKVTATFGEGGWSGAVALDHHSLWFATTATHRLGRIDTRTNKVTSTLNLPGAAFGMTAGAGAIWVTDRDDGLLFKVDPGARN